MGSGSTCTVTPWSCIASTKHVDSRPLPSSPGSITIGSITAFITLLTSQLPSHGSLPRSFAYRLAPGKCTPLLAALP